MQFDVTNFRLCADKYTEIGLILWLFYHANEEITFPFTGSATYSSLTLSGFVSLVYH